MSCLMGRVDEIKTLLLKQLNNYWIDIDEKIIGAAIPGALQKIDEGFKNNPNKRFYDGKVMFTPSVSIHWMIFLYRLSHEIFLRCGGIKEADYVYYLNKVMHSNDWFYAIDLPIHFLCEHPLGSVLGRAKYGDYLFVYQGTTVGGNRKNDIIKYPELGNSVIIYANATVLGDCHIGNNVVISADTYMIDETIPDNSVVFGKSPNLCVKTKTEKEIKSYTEHIWGWSKL